MKKHAKAAKNIYMQDAAAQARDYSTKIESSKESVRSNLAETIKNARAAQACIKALNISAAEKCLDQIFRHADNAANGLANIEKLLNAEWVKGDR